MTKRKIKYLFGRKEREQNSEFACRRDKCDTIICMKLCKLCKCYFWVWGHFRRHPKKKTRVKLGKEEREKIKKRETPNEEILHAKCETVTLLLSFRHLHAYIRGQKGREEKKINSNQKRKNDQNVNKIIRLGEKKETNSKFACRRDKCDTIICMKLCKCYFWVRGHFRRHPKEENESQTRKGRKRENKKARDAK